MPQATDNRKQNDRLEATRSMLSRMAGAPLIEVRNGVARFDTEVERNGRTEKLEIAFREVQVRENSATETVINEETGEKKRTVEVIWTTGAPVTRWSWCDYELYEESLEVTEDAIRQTRLKAGASVLNSHWSSLEDVLGVVEDYRIEDGVGYATFRMADTEDLDIIWRKIQTGIIRHLSVGYVVHEWNTTEREGEMKKKRAIDWEPHEISFVAIPADSGCSVRELESAAPAKRTESNVPQPTDQNAPADGATTEIREQTPAPAPANMSAQDKAAERALERTRQTEIRQFAKKENISDEVRDKALDDGTELADFVRDYMAGLSAESKDNDVSTTRQNSVLSERSPEREMQLRVEAFTAVELEKVGRKAKELSEEAREFASEGLRGLTMATLRNAGVSFGHHEETSELVRKAFECRSGGGVTSSGDLPLLLGEPLRATLVSHYEDALEDTDYQDWAGSTRVKDFKRNKAVYAGMFSGIRDISEGGQLPIANLGAGARYFKLGTRGMEINFTREAIINDEYGVLMDAVAKLGFIYRHDEQNIAERALNEAIMETEDGIEPIFADVHGNYLERASFDIATMSKVEELMYSQKLGDEMGGFNIRVKPARVFCAPDQATAVRNLFSEKLYSGKVADNNPFAGMPMDIKVLPGLDAGTVIVTGAKSLTDVVRVARLASAPGPQINRITGGSDLLARWETYNDFEAFGIDRYGVVKVKITG